MPLVRPLIYLVVVGLILVGCKTKKGIEPKPEDHIISFKFVQLNDVYEIAPLSGGAFGGMARVAHMVDSIRMVEPNTYLFMAGDFLNPSLLGTLKYKGERIRGRQMVEVMNAMNFELVTFGNHEFDIGAEPLQDRLNESAFYWTSANVFQQTETGPRSYNMIKDGDSIPVPETYVIHMEDTDGTKADIGLFGVTIPSNPQDYVYYADMFVEANTAVVGLQMQAVDAIVGLTHITIAQDKQLARNHPEIVHIMGGHEHYNMDVPVGNTRITKADANAKTLYVHTFSLDTKSGFVTVQSELLDVDASISEKPAVKAVVDKWEAILLNEIKTVVANPAEQVYFADPPLDGRDLPSRSTQTNLGDLITASMAASFDEPTSLALVNGGSIRIDDQLSGPVVALDIFRVLPFGGGVLKVKMNGALLKRTLNYGKASAGSGAYLQRHGLSKDQNNNWLANGAIIDDTTIYTVAISDFLLRGLDIPFLKAGAQGLEEVIQPKPEEAAIDIRKAIIQYLKTQ